MTDDPDDLITEAVMGLDDSPVETKTQFSQCVADCTKTLQMECRARSRRKGASRKEWERQLENKNEHFSI